MLGLYISVRPVYQFGELIDSYAFNLCALHSDRSKFGSIAHNCGAAYSSDRRLIKSVHLRERLIDFNLLKKTTDYFENEYDLKEDHEQAWIAAGRPQKMDHRIFLTD